MVAPRPGRGTAAARSFLGGGRGGGGEPGYALLSECINSKHMLAADPARAAPRAEPAASQRDFLGREKRGPGAGERCRGLRRRDGVWGGGGAASQRGDPATPKGLETPRHGRGRPLPASFGLPGALPLPATCPGRCLQPGVTPGYFGW